VGRGVSPLEAGQEAHPEAPVVVGLEAPPTPARLEVPETPEAPAVVGLEAPPVRLEARMSPVKTTSIAIATLKDVVTTASRARTAGSVVRKQTDAGNNPPVNARLFSASPDFHVARKQTDVLNPRVHLPASVALPAPVAPRASVHWFRAGSG
jgi:hypothetical protein